MVYKNKILIAVVAILIIFAVWYSFFKEDVPLYDFVEARVGELLQEVSLTGRVKASAEVDLAFEKGGRISFRNGMSVGSKVFVGQTIASLFNQDLYAELEQATADLRSQEAKLDELNTGVGVSELSFYETKVVNSESSLVQERINLLDKINDSYTKSDNAIRNKVDILFSNARTQNPKFVFVGGDSSLKSRVESSRVKVETLLVDWKGDIELIPKQSSVSSSDFEMKYHRVFAKDNLNVLQSFLEDVSLVVNSLAPSSGLSQAVIDGYKSDVSEARTSINTAMTNVLSAEKSLSGELSAYNLAVSELELKKSKATPEKIRAAEALVDSAGARIKTIEAQISKTNIVSPISGTIIRMEPRDGEFVSAGQLVVTVISLNNFQIEANVTEVDIAKLALGQKARVTLDAYGGGEIFDAIVLKIDPAETLIEGVATYKITLEFVDGNDLRIKPGMTANVDITTYEKGGAVLVPHRAVVVDGEATSVRVLDENNEIEMRSVVVGVADSFGEVEILSGLLEGERVVTFLK